MGRADFLYSGFVARLRYEPTPCQDNLLRKVAEFVSSDDDDIFVVNGLDGVDDHHVGLDGVDLAEDLADDAFDLLRIQIHSFGFLS